MIYPSHGVTIYIAAKVVDLRKGHDGLGCAGTKPSAQEALWWCGPYVPCKAGGPVKVDLLGRDWFGPSHGLQANHCRAVHCLQTLGTTRVQMVQLSGSRLLQTIRRAIRNGVLSLNSAQFEALFAGLEWRRVTQLEVLPPAAAE